MKKGYKISIWLGVLTAVFIFLSAFNTRPEVLSNEYDLLMASTENLKKVTFRILDTKCNVCHRKQNPFMVFNEKNMVKRAPKIYNMVFVERRMPKGNSIRLSNEEYNTLKEWLLTQQIF